MKFKPYSIGYKIAMLRMADERIKHCKRNIASNCALLDCKLATKTQKNKALINLVNERRLLRFLQDKKARA